MADGVMKGRKCQAQVTVQGLAGLEKTGIIKVLEGLPN